MALILADRLVAPRHLPWRALDVEDKIGLATGIKITIIALSPSKTCQTKLTQAKKLDFSRAAPKTGPDVCGYKIANTMFSASQTQFRPKAVTGQCPLVLASYIWIKDIDKQAKTIFGSNIKKIHHAGTYSCRRQKGNNSGTWSEHAFANAWDITGFELEDGRVISIAKDWNGNNHKLSDTERQNRKRFLRKSRNTACRLFRVVLSPDYNAAHYDHLHLDQGISSSCR